MREFTWVGTEKNLNVLCFYRTMCMYVSENRQKTLNLRYVHWGALATKG